MAELVVNLPLLGVTEHLVGFGGLLEFFLCFLVTGILVRMVFEGQFAVGGFQLAFLGVVADTEHVVIIPFTCHEILSSGHRGA